MSGLTSSTAKPFDWSIQVPRTIDLSLVLRGFFASAVVWWHVHGYKNDGTIPEILNISGRLSVWMFFGLSGFVIGYGFFSGRYTFRTDDILTYLKRRCFRILPLFWLASAMAFIAAAMAADDLRPLVDALPRQILAFQWNHLDYLVGVFWTLGVELHFYLLAPVIAWAMLRPGRVGIGVGLGLLVVFWIAFGGRIDNRSMLGNLHHFITGMLVAKLYCDGVLTRFLSTRNLILVAVTAVALVLALNLLYHRQRFWSVGTTVLVDTLIAALLFLHCGLEKRRFEAGRAAKAAMVLGVLAYGLYTWHGVLLTFWPFFRDQLTLTVIVSLILATASYVSVERPLIQISHAPSNSTSSR